MPMNPRTVIEGILTLIVFLTSWNSQRVCGANQGGALASQAVSGNHHGLERSIPGRFSEFLARIRPCSVSLGSNDGNGFRVKREGDKRHTALKDKQFLQQFSTSGK